MAAKTKIRVAVLGASGYTGADLIRLVARHPNIAITALIAKGHAGQALAQVFPHLATLDLPALVTSDQVNWGTVDVAFCGLPHATAHSEIAKLPERVKVIDMSADFRLRDLAVYAEWYGGEHSAPHLLKSAVYGLTEHYENEIKSARLVACPGCYPTAALLALLPLAKAKLIKTDGVIIDAKSGVSGAGRGGASGGYGYSETNEDVHAYGVPGHNHTAEIEQELSAQGGGAVRVTFVPHLVPMTRGILATAYARLTRPLDQAAAESLYREAYSEAPFVRVLPANVLPHTKATMGSNYCDVAVRVNARTGTAIAIAALDNLGKGAAGQAVQNLNVMCGWEETLGLRTPGLYP